MGALELAFIEVAAWLPADALDDAERSIRDTMPRSLDEDERAQRVGAIALIQAARERFNGASAGA